MDDGSGVAFFELPEPSPMGRNLFHRPEQSKLPPGSVSV